MDAFRWNKSKDLQGLWTDYSLNNNKSYVRSAGQGSLRENTKTENFLNIKRGKKIIILRGKN